MGVCPQQAAARPLRPLLVPRRALSEFRAVLPAAFPVVFPALQLALLMVVTWLAAKPALRSTTPPNRWG